MFFKYFFRFEKVSWIGEVLTRCAYPQFRVFAELAALESILQFVDHLLRMEQKRQDDLVASIHPPGPLCSLASLRSSRLRQVTHPFSTEVAWSDPGRREAVGVSPVAF